MKKLLLAAAVLVPMLVCSQVASALDETLKVRSRTLTDETFLRGDPHEGTKTTLSGKLTGSDVSGKLPVVILLHGTEGPRSYAAWNWSRYLNAAGIATLRLDSYTARDLEGVSRNQDSFGQFQQIYDLYRAVEAVDRHPRLDGSKIAVMGFSRGGTAALYAAMTRFHEAWGPRRGVIGAYIALYPACNFELVRELDVVDAPIRSFHGSDDDWALALPCRNYLDRLSAAGVDALMNEYKGALHGFDNPRNPAWFTISDAQTSRNCLRQEVDFRLINAATRDRFTYADACVERGVSVKYDEKATASAQAEVSKLLMTLFADK